MAARHKCSAWDWVKTTALHQKSTEEKSLKISGEVHYKASLTQQSFLCISRFSITLLCTGIKVMWAHKKSVSKKDKKLTVESATSSKMLTESSEQYRITITAKRKIDAAVYNHNDPRSPLQVWLFIHTFTLGTVTRIKHMHHLQTLTLPLQSQ